MGRTKHPARVLIIATNTPAYELAGYRTGLWLGELTHFYDVLADAGHDLTIASVPARFAEVGDRWAQLDSTAPGSVATLVEWFARDAAAGEGELPYPPEYPKMPGEPPRVQPSRKNAANWREG